MPSRVVGDEAIDTGSYYVALEGVTRFSLVEAVRSILRGALGHTFFPSPVEMRQQCDKAMEPHIAARRREAVLERQRRENEAIERARKSITPEGRARAAKAYADYVAKYEASKRNEPEGFISSLDPELVAQVPDAPPPRLGPDHGGL